MRPFYVRDRSIDCSGDPNWEIAVMDADHSSHPTAEVLRAFSLGRLEVAAAEAVASHVEQCEECQRRVSEMAPDTFLDRLRGVQSGHEISSSSAQIQGESQTDRSRSDIPRERKRDEIAATQVTAQEMARGA